MRVVAALATLLAVAQARLTGFQIPEVIQPGDNVNTVFVSEIFIQQVEDVACSAGFHAPDAIPQSIGARVQDIFLGPTRSNLLSSFNQTITFPASAPLGPANFRLACLSLGGVFGLPIVTIFEANITFGAETSTTLVGSSFVDAGN